MKTRKRNIENIHTLHHGFATPMLKKNPLDELNLKMNNIIIRKMIAYTPKTGVTCPSTDGSPNFFKNLNKISANLFGDTYIIYFVVLLTKKGDNHDEKHLSNFIYICSNFTTISTRKSKGD